MRRPGTTLRLSYAEPDLVRVQAHDLRTDKAVVLWHGPIENIIDFEWILDRTERELDNYLAELQLT